MVGDNSATSFSTKDASDEGGKDGVDKKQVSFKGEIIEQVREKIAEANSVLIALSANPSVDELAAAIGLSLHLDRIDKHATAIYSGETPNALEFLKPKETFSDSVATLQDFVIALNKDKADHLRYRMDGEYVKIFITPYRDQISESDLEFSYGDYNIDLVVALNVANGTDLDGALREHGRILHDAMIVNITTGEPGKLGEIEWSDKEASSVSEMLARLLMESGEELAASKGGSGRGGDRGGDIGGDMGGSKEGDDVEIERDDGDGVGTGATAAKGNAAIAKEEATAFLTGIVAATDRFKNGKTKPATMTLASKLMELGADQQLISENVAGGESKAEGEAIGGGMVEGGSADGAMEGGSVEEGATGEAAELDTKVAEEVKPAEETTEEVKPVEVAAGTEKAEEPGVEKTGEPGAEKMEEKAEEPGALLDDLKAAQDGLAVAGVSTEEAEGAVAGEVSGGDSVATDVTSGALGESSTAGEVTDGVSGGNPAAAGAPAVASHPEINGVPEMNFMPMPGDEVLPPPPTPPIDMAGTPSLPDATGATAAEISVAPAGVGAIGAPNLGGVQPVQPVQSMQPVQPVQPVQPAIPGIPGVGATLPTVQLGQQQQPSDPGAFQIPGAA